LTRPIAAAGAQTAETSLDDVSASLACSLVDHLRSRGSQFGSNSVPVMSRTTPA
jgi:hypothetical protein